MKTLKNKETKIVDDASKGDGAKKLMYIDLITVCVNQIPQGGFTPSEMKARMRLLDQISGVKEEIALEDSDVNKLKEIVASSRWTAMHPDLVQFITDVENL